MKAQRASSVRPFVPLSLLPLLTQNGRATLAVQAEQSAMKAGRVRPASL